MVALLLHMMRISEGEGRGQEQRLAMLLRVSLNRKICGDLDVLGYNLSQYDFYDVTKALI